MGTTYDPWREAERLGLTVIEAKLREGRRGEYHHDRRLVLLRTGLTYIQARSTLTHEVMHALAGDVRSPFGLINVRQETLARRRTAQALVDANEYARAELVRDGHLASIARDLEVTPLVIHDWREMHARLLLSA